MLIDNLPKYHAAVGGGAGNALAVRRKRDGADRPSAGAITGKSAHTVRRAQVPQLHRAIDTTRGQELLFHGKGKGRVGAESQTEDSIRMAITLQRAEVLAG